MSSTEANIEGPDLDDTQCFTSPTAHICERGVKTTTPNASYVTTSRQYPAESYC